MGEFLYYLYRLREGLVKKIYPLKLWQVKAQKLPDYYKIKLDSKPKFPGSEPLIFDWFGFTEYWK